MVAVGVTGAIGPLAHIRTDAGVKSPPMTLWMLALAFLLMCGCLAATFRRSNGTWIVAVVCVALTLLIYVLLSDVAIGVSL